MKTITCKHDIINCCGMYSASQPVFCLTFTIKMLIHWGTEKMAIKLQKTFSNPFSWSYNLSLWFAPWGVIDNKSALVHSSDMLTVFFVQLSCALYMYSSWWILVIYLLIFLTVSLLALEQSHYCHKSSEITLWDMGKTGNKPQQNPIQCESYDILSSGCG